MAFKLTESAQRRWRLVSAPHLAALVRAGATFFVNGKPVERPEDEAARPEPAGRRLKDLDPQVPATTQFTCRVQHQHGALRTGMPRSLVCGTLGVIA